MKYLLLLMFSFNLYAQYKVSVDNNKNGRKFGATFETHVEAQAWASEQANDESWGKNAYWSREEKEGYDNTEVVLDIESSVPYTKYHYPQEYSYSIEDITAISQANEAARLAKKNGLKGKLKSLGLSDEEIDLLVK